MNPRLRFISKNTFILLLLAVLSLATGGCVTSRPLTCAEFEANRKDAEYATQYELSESDSKSALQNFKKLPRGRTVMVRLYNMRVEPAKVKPCRHLTIHKELYLQRRTRARLRLEEVREFYSGNGILITTKIDPVGDQLRSTGYYSSDIPLPIPETAPPGKYRIVSKLVLRTKNKSRTIVLAKSSVTFHVLVPN